MSDNGTIPYSLLGELESIQDMDLPPVHLWDPPLSGDIDIRISRSGTWFHEGTAITRQRLVRLFSSILRRESDGCYYLVTPVEKWRLQVDDVPFHCVLVDNEGSGEEQVLTFTTNVADKVVLDAEHPLRFEIDADTQQPSPYLLVRDRLEALLARSVYYQVMELAVAREVDAETWLGIWSSGLFFKITHCD
jgi:hypothetical protein|tara:strand:+ start:189 stop:761 length:573 start_codon:yes stop_codon:yes gene_type:complete